MDKEVTVYIEKQKLPQKEILSKLREIITQTFPGIQEQMKWGVPYYEGKCYIHSLKDHVNLGFYLNGIPKEVEEYLEGSSKIMKHIKLYSIDDVDKKRIASLLEMLKP